MQSQAAGPSYSFNVYPRLISANSLISETTTFATPTKQHSVLGDGTVKGGPILSYLSIYR